MNWQLWEGALSPEWCEEVIEKCSSLPLVDGTVFSTNGYGPDLSIRSTKLAFVEDKQVRNTVDHYAHLANRAVYNFDVNYQPPVQYGEYSEGSFYDWHHDINWQADSMYDRKLSVVIQLSNPDTYSGGEFQFKSIETPKNFKTQGSVLVFPSYNEHRVTEVIKGVRRSLVCWLEGPRWR